MPDILNWLMVNYFDESQSSFKMCFCMCVCVHACVRMLMDSHVHTLCLNICMLSVHIFTHIYTHICKTACSSGTCYHLLLNCWEIQKGSLKTVIVAHCTTYSDSHGPKIVKKLTKRNQLSSISCLLCVFVIAYPFRKISVTTYKIWLVGSQVV